MKRKEKKRKLIIKFRHSEIKRTGGEKKKKIAQDKT